MNVLTSTKLRYETIKPKIGARILNTKEELLSGALSAEINALLEDRGVLVFKRIAFTDEEQVAFTHSVGGLAEEVRGEQVFKISLDKTVNKEAVEYLKGSLFWHVDGTMNLVPIRGSVLSSKVLPTWGGNTEFANCYAAYDDLPQPVKDQIDGLRVVHSMWHSQLFHCPEPTLDQLREVLRILHGLREFATSAPYHYAHEWELGDAVMWDNTGTLHRAMPYDPDCGRMLHRTIFKGDTLG